MEERICEWVLSLEWKVEGVIGDESKGGDCDEVICVGWGEPWGQWTEWGWRNEEGSWFHRWGDAYVKERLAICNEEDTDGRASVTTDEERVLDVHMVSEWEEFIFNVFVNVDMFVSCYWCDVLYISLLNVYCADVVLGSTLLTSSLYAVSWLMLEVVLTCVTLHPVVAMIQSDVVYH